MQIAKMKRLRTGIPMRDRLVSRIKSGLPSITETTPAVLDEAKVREKAYLIWERTGRPKNSALDNWIQAQQELLDEQRCYQEKTNWQVVNDKLN